MKKFVKYLLIILLFLVILLGIYYFFTFSYKNKHSLEKSSVEFSENIKNSPFSLSKIILYSSGYGKNKNTTFQQNSWILDIWQYTDIAIYLEHTGDELNSSNSIKKLSLENIQLSEPKIGSANLYYLDSLNFGTPNVNENYKLTDSLEFTVLNDSNEDNWAQYNTPIFFTDCSNPITLKYVNPSVKENYQITSNEPVFFDGRLLKMASIPLENLNITLNLTISLQTYDNKTYQYYLSLPISFEKDGKSIYNGNILVENKYKNYKFIESGPF